MLSIRHLNKAYRGPGSRLMLRDIGFEVAAGEYVAIMGESGVGKSTLLNLVAGLDLPDSGSIAFEGSELTALDDNARTLLRRDRMGFVFQAFHLLPHLTVAQNVMLPLRLGGAAADHSARLTGDMLEAVGIGALAAAYPRELSGGEMQRVAIARALVHRPRLVLADEPTGNLDAESAGQVLAVLREAVKRNAGAGILVTHSAAAAATTDRIYRLTAEGLQRSGEQ
ncbi:MAG: ABC transporter ATP-binding protein [Betaproteobacteria bacterium RIFCSPLOWO2_02_FULL_62_17]|nr:MAG: ABC transporter ATP-binding protein [Betaproteobacteria bacterium RIFCSPLOWO2_02_FULL_62_17]